MGKPNQHVYVLHLRHTIITTVYHDELGDYIMVDLTRYAVKESNYGALDYISTKS